jgi:alpha-glucosidase
MEMSSINWDGLYTSGSDEYRSPQEPDPGDNIRIRFRTLKGDVDSVYIHFHECNETHTMTLAFSDTYFDYYEYQLRIGRDTVSYTFYIQKHEERIHYNRLGVNGNMDKEYAFQLIPGFHVPGWLKGAVMYQIMIDRFNNGDPDNNVLDREYIYLGKPVVNVHDWDAPIEAFDVHRFYGGDIQGVWDKLDYLSQLGVKVIYFNPLFVSPSNHKYDTQDYDHIDPHIGKIVYDGGEVLGEQDFDNRHASKYRIRTTNQENLRASDELFIHFVEACHKRGMRVIIDGVFNHCGSFNKWMNKSGFYDHTDMSNEYEPGAYESRESPYHSYFLFSRDDPAAWPNNDSYEKWWGNDTLPKLNYEGSSKLEEEILRIARKWVSKPYCCDGWRLDVAADLGHSADYNHRFWKKFRKAVRMANPEACIIAEHYGDPYPWLRGDEWDTVMNYDAFMEPVTWFLTGMEKHSDSRNDLLRGDGGRFFSSMLYNMARMPEISIMSSMNQLSNHDHSRFMTRTNMTVGRVAQMGPEAAGENINVPLYRLGAMIQMTWPGAPTLYYGDEVGMVGWTEPDSRRTFPWKHEDFELLEYHKYLANTHNGYPELKYGSLMPLMSGTNFIVYARIYGSRVAVIAINSCAEEYPLTIPVWRTGILDTTEITRVLNTTSAGYNAGATHRKAEGGMLRSYMKPYSGKIYVANCHPKKEKRDED